ncbi:DUF2156 domain-containing protein [Candidatus Nomurabacteria bacterium]|nr:DUF2156 domain-containing protein [Candidatus Nomurabacteria bacterium]
MCAHYQMWVYKIPFIWYIQVSVIDTCFMIPEFPQFKKLELADKSDVETFTSRFPPYSDFNFVSMWCWDIKGEMRISQLNNNLVVRFTDYLTGDPFFSFLGDSKVNETVEALLELSEKNGLGKQLKLIPDTLVLSINRSKFNITEDLDNFDYIFDLKEISTYVGNNFGKKRNKVNKFLKGILDIKIKPLVLSDKNTQKEILDLDELWLQNRISQDVNFRFKNEFMATNRFLKNGPEEIVGIGIYCKNKLIAYSVSSILDEVFAISHFTKADTNFIGVYEFLMRENAKFLIEKGCKYLNFEQDLGLPGLRESKKSFLSYFMKKCIINFAS